MKKNYYDADSLGAVLRWFEDSYGVSSEEFYAAHCAGKGLPRGISGFNRHVWASFYRDTKRMSGPSFAERAESVLAASV